MHSVLIAVVVRRIILISLLAATQWFWLGYAWRRTARMRRDWLRLTGRVLLVAAALAIVLVVSDGVFYRFLPASALIGQIVQLWVFTSAFAFFCIKAVHGIGWLWSKLPRSSKAGDDAAPDGHNRRTFFRYSAAVAGTLPFVAAIYGYTRERLRFEIVPVDVPIPNLPAGLNGLRIVQLSDIHIGDFMPREEVRRAVDMANSLAPHLAVITGDFLTSEGDPLPECITELSRLKAPLGVWGCNGNHEIYADAEDAAEVLFRENRMTLLRHTAEQLEWNGERFNLIGVDYQRDLALTGSTRPTLSGVEPLVRQDMVNILLSHNPNTFYHAAGLGIELSLAGHTHGGQINVEILDHSWSPARFMTAFVAGLYQLPMRNAAGGPGLSAFLYVNRGLGTLGIPARIGADPEITLLTLRSG